MEYIYVALETEGKEVLGVIGFYTSHNRALKRCKSQFEGRGFNLNDDTELFDNDYDIKKYRVDEETDIPLKAFKQ